MVEATNEVAEQQDDFDYESIVLRRADPDDFDEIINLVEIGEDDIYNRVYALPNVLKLIETAYLAITVIDRDGNVVAFAAFEDYPSGMSGMVDDKHFNYWEDWFKQAYEIEEFSAFNTLWLSYFICGGSLGQQNAQYAFKQVLQTAYTSNPDLVGVFFLARGDADHDDLVHCFGPLQSYFGRLTLRDANVLAEIRGSIHRDSQVYFSPRLNVLPFIEIRLAKEEDHDDLADVFNSQSETITEAYGEYFIAELIAAQSESNKALVAQVKDKAVGLMGLTKEVDLKLLHKCFDLDAFDNLLKAEFMDAVRARRDLITAQQKRIQDNEQIQKEITRRQETDKCHILAQRMALQEHLIQNADDIFKSIEDITNNEEEYKMLDKEGAIREFFDRWLADFEIANPTGDFFLDAENAAEGLVCNIQSKLEFVLHTMEIFGLPKGYIDGAGHHLDWDKKIKDARIGKGKKAKKPKKQSKLDKMREEIERQKDALNVKPTYFDLEPFKKALKAFIVLNAESRSHLRAQFAQNQELLINVFKDEHGENSFKRCIDVSEISARLQQLGLAVDQTMSDSMSAILTCFGEIEYEEGYAERVPPETDEQRKAKMILEMRRADRAKANEGKDKKLAKQLTVEELEAKNKADADWAKEEAKLLAQMKPAKPMKALLRLTSIHDLLNAIDRMAKYDRLLTELNMTEFDNYIEEDRALDNIGKSYVQPLQLLPDVEQHRQYSPNAAIQALCEQINDLTTIPDPPESAKNAFAITLFCMEAAVDSRAIDFLKYAFNLFPDRDYLIVTQPHTVPENALLSKFTLVPKTMNNTFSHVLYLIHRDYLLEQDIQVTRTMQTDYDQIRELLFSNPTVTHDSPEVTMGMFQQATSAESPWLAFSARVEDSVVAAFLISKDVNLDYYVSHFHVQDQILMAEHDKKGHSRLVYSIINPIFEKSTRFMMKELLRLSDKTSLYFEIQTKTVIPTIFHELVHIRSRRFPHFLDRKWDHERYDPRQDDELHDENPIPVDGKDRDPLDENEAPFALCFSTKRLLSEPKILKNSRVVVVGASDTGISFVEALLSISYLHFTNITLISPGGLPHHHVPDKKGNLKSYSTSYTFEELKKLMLEARVQVIDARMTDIDRSDKNVILHDGKVIPYDTLVLTMGIQDQTLASGNLHYVSQGISSDKQKAGSGGQRVKQCSGVLSIDDPYLYKYLGSTSPLMKALTDRRRTSNCVVYGRTLNTYALIQGLLNRGVRPQSIILAIPEASNHIEEYNETDQVMQEDLPVIYPNAFDDENIEQKIQLMLEEMGITIYKQVKLMQIITDKDKPEPKQGGQFGEGLEEDEHVEVQGDANLERLLFKKLNEVDDEEEEDEDEDENRSEQEGSNGNGGMGGDDDEEDKSQAEEGQHEKKKRRKKNELELEARVLVTCGHRDVDPDVFKSIHDNGLVYNGRLIVDRHFQTTDPSIFAAGSLCEFSNRYKALSQGRSLRMDRYNGREMGSRLARSVFDIHDPHQPSPGESQLDEELPLFFLPQGQGGVLPNDIIYYHIKTTNPLILKPGEREVQNRTDLVSDNLDTTTGKGHYIKFTFNSIGLIDSVTYMGDEEIILQSLWSFVGLHENYLNELTERYENGIIPNAVEFLSENWAIALYHEWFGDFCLRMRQGIQALDDVQKIIGHAFDKTSKERKGIGRDMIKQLSGMLEPRTTRMIEEETLEFIKTNMNHLPMYYIPGQEFK